MYSMYHALVSDINNLGHFLTGPFQCTRIDGGDP